MHTETQIFFLTNLQFDHSYTSNFDTKGDTALGQWNGDDEMLNSETKIVIPKKTDVQGG